MLKEASDPVVDPGLEPARPSGATDIPAYNPLLYESSEWWDKVLDAFKLDSVDIFSLAMSSNFVMLDSSW